MDFGFPDVDENSFRILEGFLDDAADWVLAFHPFILLV